MINITIPKMHVARYDEVNQIDKTKGGVYVFANKSGEPMYVGKSNKLRERIYCHFHGGNTDTFGGLKYFYKCKYFYEEDETSREIYETYLINTLKPAFNDKKVFSYNSFKSRKSLLANDPGYSEIVQSLLCTHTKSDGETCRRKRLRNSEFCSTHNRMKKHKERKGIV